MLLQQRHNFTVFLGHVCAANVMRFAETAVVEIAGERKFACDGATAGIHAAGETEQIVGVVGWLCSVDFHVSEHVTLCAAAIVVHEMCRVWMIATVLQVGHDKWRIASVAEQAVCEAPDVPVNLTPTLAQYAQTQDVLCNEATQAARKTQLRVSKGNGYDCGWPLQHAVAAVCYLFDGPRSVVGVKCHDVAMKVNIDLSILTL